MLAAFASRRECEVASSVKDELVGQLDAAATRNKEICKKLEDGEKEFQVKVFYVFIVTKL